jgi:phosphonoacetaldehyde hydrolase
MAMRDRFDLVIFDWAGTTVDFGCLAPVVALREAFARRGVAISDAQARRDMGKSKADHVRALLLDPVIARAWLAATGAPAGDVDVDALMSDLGPLMRDQAARAARLIDGVRPTFDALRAAGVRVASSTGYTRAMMAPVVREAAEQGYLPEHLVCADETPQGRPSPLMIYKACAELGVWPLSRVVKVDDSEAGMAEGRAAGCFTVGVAASGNGVGLSLEALQALPPAERAARISASRQALLAAGADIVIDSVADLLAALEAEAHDVAARAGTAPHSTAVDSAAIARACEQLIYRAAHFTDFGRWDELAALYAEDGKLVRPSDPANPIVGRANILASLRARPLRTTRHVLSNITVELRSPTLAHVSSTVTLFLSSASPAKLPTKGQRILVGHFEDEVTLVNGAWAFLVRDGSMALEFDTP